VVRVEKPTKPRAEWAFREWHQWAQWTRQRAGLVPEDPPPIADSEAWWGSVMAWTDGDVEPLCDAFIAYGDDTYWQGEKLPFRGFLSQWKRFMPLKEDARAS
jgi:hypothetical protein